MSAVIGAIKKIDRVDYRPDNDCGEALGIEASATGTPLKRLIDYAVRRTYVEKVEDVDIGYDINELENRILAAESKVHAKDRQISELSIIRTEDEKVISSLQAKLKKYTTPKPKKWPNYILGARTLHIWLIMVSLTFGMFIMSIFYTFLN